MQTNKINKIDGGTETINKIYTSSTEILDYEDLSIQHLIKSRAWMKLNEYEKIGAAYQ